MGNENPNPAQEARRQLAHALAAQQQQIDILSQSQSVLRHAVAWLASAAGVPLTHPVIASLGVKKIADEANPAQPIPSEGTEAPAATTEQARKPDATADVESPGGVPGANTGVQPDGHADVTAPGEVMAAPAPLATQDPTKEVSGTDNVPSPQKAQIHPDIIAPPAPEPTKTMFEETGWKNTSSANGEHRLLSAMRLARLRKAAGIVTADVDDLALGQQIHDSDASDEAIEVETSTLATLTQRHSGGAAPVARNMVPQRAAAVQRTVPSLAPNSDEDRGIYATAASDTQITDDELGFAG